VDSAPGEGTTFRLFFPRLELPQRVRPQAEAVLVVEREPQLLSLVQRVLEGEGFIVLPARDASEAEARLREYRGAVAIALASTEAEDEHHRLGMRLSTLRPGLRLMPLRGRAPTAPQHDGVAPGVRSVSLESLPTEVRRALGRVAPPEQAGPLLH
jgi:two-component system, cell cycle sensor histidine kinase and response regulator CckA